MITFIGKERGDTGSGTRSIIVSEFGKRKQGMPVVLLVIAKYSEVLFQGLVGSFGLSVTFGMITGGKV